MKQTVNFKDLKAKVGVDDIAYYLGYRLDRSAGVGRYIEMVLPDTTGHKDKAHHQESEGEGFTDLFSS